MCLCVLGRFLGEVCSGLQTMVGTGGGGEEGEGGEEQ